MTLYRTAKYSSESGLLVLLILAVCAMVILVHWPALSAQALYFDDDQYLMGNTSVQNPSFSSAWRFLSEVLEPSTVHGYYQPLTMLLLMLDCSLGGRTDNLMPFHRTSLILHAANTALIILLLYLLFGRPWTAAAIGLLFGLHPMTVEPIPWISERKTLLAAFFALWCLILYVRYAQKRGWKLYIGCFVFYLLALMSKPTSTPLPALMLLLDFWPLRRFKLKTLVEKIPFFVLGGISAVITYISQSRTSGVVPFAQGGVARIVFIFYIISHNIIFYIYKIIWPVNLSPHYPFPDPVNLFQPQILAGVIGTCIFIPLLIISLKWTRAAFTGWLFFFIAILPAIQITGFQNAIAADRYAYLPAIGFLLALTTFLNCLYFTVNSGKNVFWYVTVSIIVFALACSEAVATRQYLTYWRDSTSLYQHTISLAPEASPLYYNFGNLYSGLGRYQDAVDAYKQAIQIKPDFAEACNNLGVAYGNLGRYEDAIEAFKQAIKIKPDYAEAYYNLGVAYRVLRRYEDAADTFKQALRIKPDYFKGYYSLGNAYLNLGRYQDAINAFKQAVKVKPNYIDAHYNLGISWLATGNKGAALEEYEALKRLDAEKADKLFNLINK